MDAQQEKKKAHFLVNGKRYDLPHEDDVTLGEAEDWESIAGVPFGSKVASARTTIAWLYLAMRHGNARITIDEIRQLKHHEFDVVEGDEPDPPAPSPLAENNGSGESHDSEEIQDTGGSQPS